MAKLDYPVVAETGMRRNDIINQVLDGAIFSWQYRRLVRGVAHLVWLRRHRAA